MCCAVPARTAPSRAQTSCLSPSHSEHRKKKDTRSSAAWRCITWQSFKDSGFIEIPASSKASLAIAADAGSSVSVTMDQIAIADLAAFEHLGKQPAPVNERFDNAFAGDFLKPRTGFIQLESTQRCVTHLENLIHEVR